MTTGPPSTLPRSRTRQLGSDLFHALSQPLTALCCSLELALQQTLTAEEYRESVSRALMQAERVSWLTMGIRELFEAEQAGEDCEVLPLQVAVASAIDDVLLVAEAAGVRICWCRDRLARFGSKRSGCAAPLSFAGICGEPRRPRVGGQDRACEI